jgi:hypothetical protein
MVRRKHLAVLFLIGVGLGLASWAAAAAYYDTGPYVYSACPDPYPYSYPYSYPCDDGRFDSDDRALRIAHYHDSRPDHSGSGHLGGGGGHSR